MSIESTRARIEVVNAEIDAAERIARLKIAQRTLEQDDYDRIGSKLEQVAREHNDAGIIDLTSETIADTVAKYWSLLDAPESDRITELAPLSTPNGRAYWREINVEDIGSIEICYSATDSENQKGTAYYFAICSAERTHAFAGAEKSTITYTRLDKQKPNQHPLAALSEAYVQNQLLTDICTAAGLLEPGAEGN